MYMYVHHKSMVQHEVILFNYPIVHTEVEFYRTKCHRRYDIPSDCHYIVKAAYI